MDNYTKKAQALKDAIQLNFEYSYPTPKRSFQNKKLS